MTSLKTTLTHLSFILISSLMSFQTFAAQHEVELVRASLGQSSRGATAAAELTGINFIYDDVAGTLTQTSALTEIGFQISPASKLFRHRLRGLVFDLSGVTISASAFECVEGNFGSAVGANLCANTNWGTNFINETTWDYSTIPATRVISGDDEGRGAQQQLSDYASALVSFDFGTLIIETPAWTANPEHAGMQFEFTSTAVIARIDVPDVRGLDQAMAESDITAAGLTAGTITTANHPSVPAGQVISQNPSECLACALSDSPVNIVISLGAITGNTVPDQLTTLEQNISALNLNFLLNRTLLDYIDRILTASQQADYALAKQELDYFILTVDWVYGWLIPFDDGLKLITDARSISARLDKQLKTPPQTGLREFVSSDNRDRSYYIEIPDDYSPVGEPKPVLLMLHGTGGTYERFMPSGLYAIEGEDLRAKVGNDAIMVFPNALPNENGTNQWDQNYDIEFFRDLFAELQRDLVFDENRIFVTGHSSGAGFSYELGCQLGDIIRAIAPSAGALKSPACIGSVAVMHVQSENDTVVFPGITEPTKNFWILYNGFDANIFTPGVTDPCRDYSAGNGSLYPLQICMHEDAGRSGHQWWTKAGAIWDFFATLPIAKPTTDFPPGGGNDRVNEAPGTTLTFTVEFPSAIGEVWNVAAVLYPAGTQPPVLTGPLWFLNINIPPGDAIPGTQQRYEVDVQIFDPSPDAPLPGTYSLSIVGYVTGGGYPTPIADIDYILFHDILITDKKTPIVVEEVLILEPVQ